MPPAFKQIGSLIQMDLDAASAPQLYTIGFRITDRGHDMWTNRFNAFKLGRDRTAVEAGVRTMCEAIATTGGPLPSRSRVVVAGAISSGHTVMEKACPVARLGHGIAKSESWEWRPELLRKDVHRSLHSITGGAERDSEVAGKYVSDEIEGLPGLFVIVDDMCTRGATAAEIRRAVESVNPGWEFVCITLAKTERQRHWGDSLTNDHIPIHLDDAWMGK